MKKCLLLMVTMLALFGIRAQQTFTYAQRDTMPLMMDVYQPLSPRQDHACVLYMFGGGFLSGERNNKQALRCCHALADRGFVVVAIDYRLYLKNVHPTSIFTAHALFDTAIRYAVEDCSEAIAYLCKHADELHIDTSNIILTGSSAGAIGVLQTDYCRSNHLPEAAALPPTFRPVAVIPYAGAVYCRVGHLSYDLPPAPTCMFHGTSDRIVNYNCFRGSIAKALYGTNRLAKVFKKNGYSYWVMRYKDHGHEIAGVIPETIDDFCLFADVAISRRALTVRDAECIDSTVPFSDWGRMSLIQLYFSR